MPLISAAMAHDVARSADEVAAAIAPVVDRPRADACVAALVTFALSGADLSVLVWTGPVPDCRLTDAIVRVTAGWPTVRRSEASAWQLLVSAVRLTIAPAAAARRGDGRGGAA